MRSKGGWRLLALGVVVSGMGAALILAGRLFAPPPRLAAASDDPRFGEPYPKAEVDEYEYSFGEMDVGQTGSHTFLIRNVGDGSLKLRTGKTSCHCTALVIEDFRVPPGGTGRVRVEWQTDKPVESFRHGGFVKTDDPGQREIRPTVVGTVRAQLSAAPAEATFASVAQGDKAVGKVTLYSQVWDDIEIVKLECESAAVSWRVDPVADTVLTELKARSAQELILEAGPGLPLGAFQSLVRVHARPAGDPDAAMIVRELLFQGQVVSDITLSGPGYANGVWDLGMIAKGHRGRAKLHVFVRGEHKDLDVGKMTVKPEFVRVTMARDPSVPGKVAHYVIDVEVPSDAPLIDCLEAENLADVRIAVDHPDMPEIAFRLGFAVVPDLAIAGPTTATFEKPASEESKP